MPSSCAIPNARSEGSPVRKASSPSAIASWMLSVPPPETMPSVRMRSGPPAIPIHEQHFAGFYGGPTARLTGWDDVQPSPFVATKHVDRTVPRPNGGSATEHSTYVLRHVPRVGG